MGWAGLGWGGVASAGCDGVEWGGVGWGGVGWGGVLGGLGEVGWHRRGGVESGGVGWGRVGWGFIDFICLLYSQRMTDDYIIRIGTSFINLNDTGH